MWIKLDLGELFCLILALETGSFAVTRRTLGGCEQRWSFTSATQPWSSSAGAQLGDFGGRLFQQISTGYKPCRRTASGVLCTILFSVFRYLLGAAKA